MTGIDSLSGVEYLTDGHTAARQVFDLSPSYVDTICFYDAFVTHIISIHNIGIAFFHKGSTGFAIAISASKHSSLVLNNNTVALSRIHFVFASICPQ